jgi:hypothetical protein
MDVCDSGNFRLTKNQGVSSFVVYRGMIDENKTIGYIGRQFVRYINEKNLKEKP